jgi:hypothetical protein
VDERVQELHSVTVFDAIASLFFEAWFILFESSHMLHPGLLMRIAGHDIQDFNFVKSRLLVVGCALLDFECNISVVMRVACEPDSRKVAPSELLDDNVAIDHDLSQMHRMVAAYFIVWDALILARVTICK